jgi:hypothetical protein
LAGFVRQCFGKFNSIKHRHIDNLLWVILYR